jgi:hypothetical protein
MDPLLFTPPPTYTLPVTKGADILLTFANQVPGSDPPSYTDFPDGSSVTLIVNMSTPLVGEGVITGYSAVCQIPYTEANTIEDDTPWLCVVVIPVGDSTYTTVPMHGTVQRYDGLT